MAEVAVNIPVGATSDKAPVAAATQAPVVTPPASPVPPPTAPAPAPTKAPAPAPVVVQAPAAPPRIVLDTKTFSELRTAQEFAKDSLLDKTKAQNDFLQFQSTVIPASLLRLPPEANLLAMQVHKDLLSFCGEKDVSDPSGCAQDLLRKGLANKSIRDEIFMQLIKHLTNNPRPESSYKAWQMMCICCGTFAPSSAFQPYLTSYMMEKRDVSGKGAVVDYAKYALRALEATLASGEGSGYILTGAEISSWKDRPPILISITLIDDSVIADTLPIPPHMNVDTLLAMCCRWLGLTDVRMNTMGLFLYDLGDSVDPSTLDEATRNAPYRSLRRTPRPLRSDDFIGDIYVQKLRQKRKFKFVFKKKLFLPFQNSRGFDPIYENLIYMQAEEDAVVQGHILINDEEKVIALAGMSMLRKLGDKMGATMNEILEQFPQKFVIPSWRNKKTPTQWAKAIHEIRESLFSLDRDDMMESYVRAVQGSPLYGMNWFYTLKAPLHPKVVYPETFVKLPPEILIGLNSEGMTFFDLDHRPLLKFSFADIFRWGGTPTQFSFILSDVTLPDAFEFTVYTGQATDMAATILDLMKAVIADKETNVVIQ